MLQFIKGQGTALYFELIQKNSAYREALYLDTDAKCLYFDGQATDIKINVITEIDDDYKNRLSYKFTNSEGDTTVVKDSVIPEINDYEITLHDMSNGTDNEFSNGLYAVKDKFLVQTMAEFMGIQLSYVYYAHINTIRYRLNNDTATKEDVIVYKNEDDGKWYYDYEEFTYNKYVLIDGEYRYIGVDNQPAGSEEVEEKYVRLQSMKAELPGGIQPMYDGGVLDDNKKTIRKHGGVPEGTKVKDLEQHTQSEVLSEILFETAHPVKICDTSAYIKFTDEYVSKAEKNYVDVGLIYPAQEDIELFFTPETWQNYLDGSLGEPQEIATVLNTKYYINDEQHPWTGGHGKAPDNIYDMSESGYAEHHDEFLIAENDKSVYYAVVTYQVTDYPLDTDDSSTYVTVGGETVTYRSGESLEVGDSSAMTTNFLHMDGTPSTATIECNIVAGWRVASNADYVTNETIWDERYEEANDFKGNDDKTLSNYFSYNDQTLYAKWTSLLAPEDKLYIYLPVGFTISEIGGAHDAIGDDWSAESYASLVKDPSTNEPLVFYIKNQFDVQRDYHQFEIKRALGITSVKFKIASL